MKGHECQGLHTSLKHMLLIRAGDKMNLLETRWTSCHPYMPIFTTLGSEEGTRQMWRTEQGNMSCISKAEQSCSLESESAQGRWTFLSLFSNEKVCLCTLGLAWTLPVFPSVEQRLSSHHSRETSPFTHLTKLTRRSLVSQWPILKKSSGGSLALLGSLPGISLVET